LRSATQQGYRAYKEAILAASDAALAQAKENQAMKSNHEAPLSEKQ
jgi:hypothetical protein